MKIAFLADLHYGNLASNEGVCSFETKDHKFFAKKVHDEKPDILIVAGDIAETCIKSVYLKACLDTYKNPHGESLCIPGNHDLWLSFIEKQNKYTHEEKYEAFYKKVQLAGWVGLRDKPFEKDGIWIVGNSCWYDFSSVDPLFNATIEMWKQQRDWVDFPCMNMDSALKVSESRMKEFDKALALVPKERKALICVTHFIGFPRLMADEFLRPDYGAAFMGNYNIGKKIVDAGADFYAMGHSHRRKEFQLDNLLAINNGSGYGFGSKKCDLITFDDNGKIVERKLVKDIEE